MNNVTTLTPLSSPEKHRTITLTGRAPIKIKESDWPVIADGYEGYEIDGAPYGWCVKFKLRRDKRGRAIFYGTYTFFDEDVQGHENVRVGRLMSEYEVLGDLWKIMQEVADDLRARIMNESLRPRVALALDQVFADLDPLDR